MTTPSIAAFLDAAADRLATVEGVASCEVSRGRYRPDEISANSFRCPAVRVAAGAVKRLVDAGDGTRDVTLRVSLAIITKDGEAGSRAAQAVALLDSLVLLLPTNPWGLDWAGTPASIDGQNAYTGSVGRQGLMVWELGFDQVVRVGEQHPATAPELSGQIPDEVTITHRLDGTEETLAWRVESDG